MKKYELKQQQVINQLKETGEWFWSKRFIEPHTNKMLVELEKYHNIIIKTIKTANSYNIVDQLLNLKINKHILIKIS